MLIKRTIIDQIELTRSRIIQIRFRKEVVEDGNVLAFEYHRTSLPPGISLDDQMAAVNENLAAMGCARVEAGDIERIRAIVNVEHTPEVITAYRAATE